MDAAIHKHRYPKCDLLRQPKPAETVEERRDVDVLTGTEDSLLGFQQYHLDL